MFIAQAVLNAILFKNSLAGNKRIVYLVTGLLPPGGDVKILEQVLQCSELLNEFNSNVLLEYRPNILVKDLEQIAVCADFIDLTNEPG